jgi:uncharacterized membrane protein
VSKYRECRWFPTLVLGLLIVLYLVHFSALSVAQHNAFMTHTRDLGNMDQPIWNTLHGRFLEETRADGRQASRLTDHFEPIFILISLVFLIWDDVRALLALQTVFIALGAVPVFWLARDRFATKEDPQAGCWMGVAFAAVYLLFPALQAANLTEFHAVPLAAPLLLCTYYYGRRGQTGWFWLFGLLSMTVKEDITLLVAMVGLYVFWKGKKRWAGLALAGVSLAWFSVATFVIIPAAGQAFYADIDQSLYFARYGEFGSGPRDILMNMIKQPLQVLQTVSTPDRLAYLAGLLASVGFLAIFDLGTVLIALPLFLANLLSNYPAMYSGEMHYSAPLTPFMIAGAVGGAGWLSDRLIRRFPARRRAVYLALALWLLLCSLGYQVVRGYTPLSVRYEWPTITEHHRLLSRFADQIPPDAALSTTPPLFPHFSHRQRIHQFPVFTDAEYILLDAASVTDMNPNDFRQSFLDLFAFDFLIMDASDGYILLRKSLEGSETLPDEFYSFVRVDAASPDYPYHIDFEDSLRFLGFSIIDDPLWQLTRVRMYWEVLKEPTDSLRIYPFFLNRDAEIVEDTRQRPLVGAVWYPPSEWQAGDILQLETLPWDLGDEFSFCIGVTRSGEWHDHGSRLRVREVAGEAPAYVMEDRTWARLLTFERRGLLSGSRLAPLYMADEARRPARERTNIRFANADDAIDLLGYAWTDADGPDGAPALTLYWRADQPVTRDYSVFVHVQNPDLGSLPQTDSAPNWRGPMPTSSWPAGAIVPDTHVLHVPDNAGPGRYEVTVGLYYWESMERLGATGPTGEPLGDAVSLTTLEVESR